MQLRRAVGFYGLFGVLLIAGVVLAVLVWYHPQSLGMAAGSVRQTLWFSVFSATTFVLLAFLGGYYLLGRPLGRSVYRRPDADDVRQPAQTSPDKSVDTPAARTFAAIEACQSKKHGPFWRRKTRLFLVIGEPEQIKAIAPNLSPTHWLQGHDTVLLWGGSMQGKLDDSVIELCRHLTRWRALDGVVWALSREQSADQRAVSLGVNHLQTLARQLKWPLSLHLWQVCDSQWAQDGRPVQPVGCRLPTALTPEALDTALASLLEPLRREGLAQMNEQPRHDFLLRLSRDLQVEGVARWRQALAPLFGGLAQEVPLRGLWFSLPLPGGSDASEHHWPLEPAWEGVLGDRVRQRRRLGWSAPRVAYVMVLGLALLWGAGLLLSFVSNRVQIAQLHSSLAALQPSGQGDEQTARAQRIGP